jgi:hypothetical protein
MEREVSDFAVSGTTWTAERISIPLVARVVLLAPAPGIMGIAATLDRACLYAGTPTAAQNCRRITVLPLPVIMLIAQAVPLDGMAAPFAIFDN